MDLVVIAGAHASACTGLRHQILAGAEALRGEGVHVPTSYGEEPRTWHNLAWEIAGMPGHRPALGTIAGTVEEAKQSGSARILLMSEEFETAAMQPEAVDRLAALATDLGGRATVLIVFRHQMSYLNLVFAFRSINGIHGLWFEDFVRAPTPPRQFDYLDVVDRFDRPDYRRHPVRPRRGDHRWRSRVAARPGGADGRRARRPRVGGRDDRRGACGCTPA